MVPAERLHKGHDLAGTEELLSSDEAVAASLYQGGGLAADIAEPVAVAPDRHDCDRQCPASTGRPTGPSGKSCRCGGPCTSRQRTGGRTASSSATGESTDEVADAGDKPGHHCAAVILALLRMRAPPR
jgi:hypothetical protein